MTYVTSNIPQGEDCLIVRPWPGLVADRSGQRQGGLKYETPCYDKLTPKGNRIETRVETSRQRIDEGAEGRYS